MTEKTKSEQTLKELMEGNARFVSGNMIHPHHGPDRRKVLRNGQRPFAVILGCSDSRVPPEILFDQGLGALFVLRVAGNVLDDIIMAGIEYAVGHLHTPLVVVLGHSRCGAFHSVAAGGEFEGHLSQLAAVIKPVLDESDAGQGDLDSAIRLNAELVSQRIAASKPVVCRRVDSGELLVVPAYYDLDSGCVEIL